MEEKRFINLLAMLDKDEFQEAFKLRDMPGEENYQSLGGFVIHMLGTIPQTGDNFDWNNWNFEIVDMDNYRIDKILITPATKDDRAEK